MINASIMELETNLSFDAEIDATPAEKLNFATFYVDEKEYRRPTSVNTHGVIEFNIQKPASYVEAFLNKWYKTRKRIDIMLEADGHMYLMKGCYIRSFTSAKEAFTVFYNTFKES